MITDNPCELSICVDCMMVLANGESTYSDDESERVHHAGMAEQLGDYDVTLGRLTPNDVCEGSEHDSDCVCDQLGFSWSLCDGCGSKLGGDRYAATLWLPVAAPAP